MIRLHQLTLQRGVQRLLDTASVTLQPRRKIALVGRNGSGKSSLFALLLGQISPENGELTLPAGCRIAHMAQEIAHSDRTAIDFVLDGHTALREIQARIAAAEAANETMQLGELYAELEAQGGYHAEPQAAELLHGLGFAASDQHRPVSEFSGGWRIRLNLARALMRPSDLLLLDEPTNHLDLDTIAWLERRLQHYPGTLICISHDRDFIDQVADGILHLTGQQLHLYSGHYTDFERQRAAQIATQQARYAQQQQQIRQIQGFIDRFRAKASKAKQAQSRLKQLANLEQIAQVQTDSPFSLQFLPPEPLSQPLLSAQDLQLGYADQPVLRQVHLSLLPGDRIGLLGVNGAGKSTLIQGLTGSLTPQAGEVIHGEHCRIGYFAQHQLEALDTDASALVHLQRAKPTATNAQIRQFLGGFDFRGDQALVPIAPFSGGEKARLALALIVWQQPNLLLLDEPTNHLDLEMRSALTLALQTFTGALVVVSHDRHLLRHSVDQYWLVAQGRVSEFRGTLDEYEPHTASVNPTTRQTTHPPAKQQRQQAAATRKAQAAIQRKIQQVERRMEQLDAELHTLITELADPTLYTTNDKARLPELTQRQTQLQHDRDALDDDWLQLHEQLTP
ncbi:MAG: ATP-binding cassette domain-containing protein [Pseudomonadota bacterium]